jgi:hypothetical protein
LRELRRVSKRTVLVSLPDVTPYARWHVEWGFLRTRFHRFFDIKNRRPQKHEFNGEHYWEIGKLDFPLDRITASMNNAGLDVVQISRVEEDPYHRFFRCAPR